MEKNLFISALQLICTFYEISAFMCPSKNINKNKAWKCPKRHVLSFSWPVMLCLNTFTHVLMSNTWFQTWVLMVKCSKTVMQWGHTHKTLHLLHLTSVCMSALWPVELLNLTLMIQCHRKVSAFFKETHVTQNLLKSWKLKMFIHLVPIYYKKSRYEHNLWNWNK